VRGICSLRPGVKGLSDTMEVVSIVDRFLEHSRVYYFRNGGDEEVYLSTADWMPRNLDRRIELLVPVAPDCRKKVVEVLDYMFLDNVKARRLMADGTYRRKRPSRGEEPFRAQMRLYEQMRRAAERARAAATPVFEPVSMPPEKASSPS
jgi:polyphosphate kinase